MRLNKLRKLKSVQDSIYEENKEQEFISTGVATLNILFGGGIDKGIPVGKVSMIAADSSLGKSFIALKIAKNAQTKGKSVILFDAEKAFNKALADNLGIQENEMLVIQETSLEKVTQQFMNIVDELGEDVKDTMFIIDSWNVLVTSKTIDDASAGNDKTDMTTAKKKNTLAKLLLNSGATIFVVNQLYACVNPNTFVKTESGSKKIGDLLLGDKVMTRNGLEPIINKFEYEDAQVYEITLENGDVIEATGRHKFVVNGEWKSVEDLIAGDILSVLKIIDIKVKRIPKVVDIETPSHEYILDNGVISHNSMDSYSLDTIGGAKGIYYSSSSIVQATSKAKQKESDGEISGAIVTAMTRKGRFSREHSKLKYLINYDGGFNAFYGLLDIALEGGYVTKPSAGYYTRTHINEDKKLREKDIYTEEFWRPIFNDTDFKAYVEKAYSFKHNEINEENIEF